MHSLHLHSPQPALTPSTPHHIRTCTMPLPFRQLMAGVLPEALQPAAAELAGYFADSFGNATRIDYGTGAQQWWWWRAAVAAQWGPPCNWFRTWGVAAGALPGTCQPCAPACRSTATARVPPPPRPWVGYDMTLQRCCIAWPSTLPSTHPSPPLCAPFLPPVFRSRDNLCGAALLPGPAGGGGSRGRAGPRHPGVPPLPAAHAQNPGGWVQAGVGGWVGRRLSTGWRLGQGHFRFVCANPCFILF